MLIKDKALRERAELVIPGGMYGHQSAKYFTEDVPQYFSKANGAYLWDYDNNQYIDYLCGYGTNLLGYLDQRVESVASAQQKVGDSMSGPSELMITLAEDMTQMIGHADWAMFCKNGSDATSMALVCARAYRNQSKVLVAEGAYHGAHTWNTPSLEGITAEDRSNIVYFKYNDIESLNDAIKSVDGQFAAIFATPFRHEVIYDQFMVTKEYAEYCRKKCDEHEALLVVDEVRTGFRLSRDCFWSTEYGVDPDLSTWGKCFANGYPISALLGSNKARDAAQRIFVTGSFWFSSTPMAAAIETLKIIRETNYLEIMTVNAEKLRQGLAKQADDYGYGLRQTGPAVMTQILFDGDDEVFKFGRNWVGHIMQQGSYFSFYHNMFITSAHTENDILKTLEHTDYAFSKLKKEAA